MELKDYNYLREQSADNTLILGTNETNISALMMRKTLDDIHAGFPVVSIDPTGKYNDEILKFIPRERQTDVIVIDPARQPFALNVFANILGNRVDMFASTLSETLKGLWFQKDASTPVFDLYFRTAIRTALSLNGSTFYTMEHLLTDEDYRKDLLKDIRDPVILRTWAHHDKRQAKDRITIVDSTYNKLNAFAFSQHLRNCLDQKRNCLTFKDKIVLVSLRERELGTDNARLLGALVLALLYVEDTPQNLYLYGASSGTAILGKLLTTCPSVRTTLAVQYLDDLTKDFKPALLGGVRTIVTLRTSNPDATYLRPYLNIRNGDNGTNEIGHDEAYVCRDGITHRVLLESHSYPETHQTQKIMARCLSQYTAPVESIQNRIARFTK